MTEALAASARSAQTAVPLRLGALHCLLDPSGCLVLPDHGTLIVSDLHFEKGSSLARRGQFVPPYDTHETLQRLEAVLHRLAPKRVIALGDSFHDSEAAERLPESLADRIMTLTERHDWLWVAGNHDPEAPARLGGCHAKEIALDGVTLRHEPQRADGSQMAGHLHPSARVVQRGRSIRRKAFVTDGRTLILPAFGALTGSLNCRDAAFADVLDMSRMRAFLLAREAVIPIDRSRLAPF